MADDNFFEPSEGAEEAPVEKIKVGDEEYTQEDLQKLVGLGKIGQEAESKYKIKIDGIWPKFQQTINDKGKVEARVKELETQIATPKVEPTREQLNADQMRSEAIKQAKELGLVTREDFETEVNKRVSDMIQGQKLLDNIDKMIDEKTADGLPSTTTDEVLDRMREKGYRDPEDAYMDLFRKEYLENEAKKISTIKGNSTGLPTIEKSQAGSKQPAPVNFRGMSDERLAQMMAEAGGQG